MKATTKVLSCSACAKRFFGIRELVCPRCGMATSNAIMMSALERRRVRERYDRMVAASRIDPDYNQEKFEADNKWLFG